MMAKNADEGLVVTTDFGQEPITEINLNGSQIQFDF